MESVVDEFNVALRMTCIFLKAIHVNQERKFYSNICW